MKMMKFGDGLKEIKVGMTVYVTNGQSGSHFRVREDIVEKVGNSLVSLAHSSNKFYLDTGREQSNYVAGTIYSSLEAYQEIKAQAETIFKVNQALSSQKLSYQQAVQIAEILGLSL